MILTNEQEKALKIILEKYKNHEKYVTICGFAGVGKSTLVKFAIEALDVDQDRVTYACYTGKAAEVLRRKGNKNAMTLHRLLYDSIPRPGGGFFRKPKMSLEYDIVVVDEISLAPKSMIDMLLKHKVFCIFIGDNFQLSQIDKTEAHDYLEHPDIFLSTIMRQAQESEIIRLTMDIREGKTIKPFKGEDIIILPKKELNTGILLWGEQVICATNVKRMSLNNDMRNLLGFEGNMPNNGEKVMCLRNYWNECSENGDALVNGITGTIKNPFESFRNIPRFLYTKTNRIPLIIGDFITDYGSSFESLEIDKNLIVNGKKSLEWRDEYKLGQAAKRIGDLRPKEFTYGYAMTGWKAQGSEWDKVVVIEENFPFDREEHKKFLYTCATRASEKLVLILD